MLLAEDPAPPRVGTVITACAYPEGAVLDPGTGKKTGRRGVPFVQAEAADPSLTAELGRD